MTKKEKGKKWDGRSRISNDQYKKNWNDIFGNKNVVRTEASFISRDYSEDQTYENEIVYKSKGNRKSNKSSI
jgi:hypothetical protein